MHDIEESSMIYHDQALSFLLAFTTCRITEASDDCNAKYLQSCKLMHLYLKVDAFIHCYNDT